MTPFEVTLAEAIQDGVSVPAVKAHNLSLVFQNAMQTGESLNEGNVTIDGKQTILVANGQSLTTALPSLSVRCSELETVVSKMQEGPEKVKAQAKLDIWKAFIIHVQGGLTTALKAQYDLDNPQEA